MANSLRISSAKKTFGSFYEPMDASEYIYNKKAKATYCVANNCVPSVKVGSESNLLLFNRSNRLTFYPCKNSINKTNLNINLITKLDLKDVPVIKDISNNEIPAVIKYDAIPFLDYDIDPSGNLFGNTICGINNFVKYVVYDTSNNETIPLNTTIL
jgi:hypothetical protein